MSNYYVYILASKRNGTLYIGVTDDILKRMQEHKYGVYEGFSKKYSVHRLVYFEIFEQASDSIKRERQLKEWKRQWKVELIEKHNQQWNELYGILQDMDPDFRRE